MISEAGQQHKNDLLRSVEQVEDALRVRDHASLQDAALAVERTVVWIAVVLRRLADQRALPEHLDTRRWKVGFHPRRPEGVRAANGTAAIAADIAAVYDLDISRAAMLSLRRLCGLIIHSHVLAPVLSDDGSRILGVRVNSSLTKGEGLFLVSWSVIREAVHASIEDQSRFALL